ncbi:hypothetical protein D3C85_1493770 [compost metagenome]
MICLILDKNKEKSSFSFWLIKVNFSPPSEINPMKALLVLLLNIRRPFGLSPIKVLEYVPEKDVPDITPVSVTVYLLSSCVKAGSSQVALIKLLFTSTVVG